MSIDLSILIPSRQEPFLKRTVDDVFANARGSIEVLVCYDGSWPVEGLPANDRLTELHVGESIGQRAATNRLAKLARGRYIMKLDAHCGVDEGFDVKLVELGDQLGPLATQIPTQFNLHVFDWQCQSCGKLTYQGAKPAVCAGCAHPEATFEKQFVWKRRMSRRTEGWRFDTTLHFEYWTSYRNSEFVKALPDYERFFPTLTALGACFVMQKQRFEQLGGLDEGHGSWGQYGVEVALKSQLSGGSHVVNRTTWFSHLFRTQPGFGFPYPISGKAQERAREYSRKLWFRDAWAGQTISLRQLLNQYSFVPEWFEADGSPSPYLLALRSNLLEPKTVYIDGNGRPASTRESRHAKPADDVETVAAASKPVGDGNSEQQQESRPKVVSIRQNVPAAEFQEPAASAGSRRFMVYYSDCRVEPAVGDPIRRQLAKIAVLNDLRIVSVTIPGPHDARWPNYAGDVISHVVLPCERGYLTMFKQIRAGCELALKLGATHLYLTEHDVLYHPTHFDFIPPAGDRYFYNLNVWKVAYPDGRAVTYDTKQTSGCVAEAELLTAHYVRRVQLVEQNGFTRKMGFEPGSHNRSERVDDVKSDSFLSAFPNLDIRHGSNLTQTRWSREQFRDQRNCQNWQESEKIVGWGKVAGGMIAKILLTV